jgi:hypothetical protein
MTFHPGPPRSQSISISGTLLYEPGSWGANRPLRRSAVVNFLVREPPAGLLAGPEHPLSTTIVDGDGKFSIDAPAMSIPAGVTSIEEFLRIQYLPTLETKEITLENVRWGFGVSQDVGSFRFNWTPPEPVVAEVNGRWFDDPKGLAGNLAELLMDAQPKPYSARTSNIVLLREPSEADEYTRAQLFFQDLAIDAQVHQDFADRLYKELEMIPMLRTRMKTISDAMLNYLFKIAAFQQYQFERGKTLEFMIKAIGKSLGWIIDEAVYDPMPDAAAVCALIYTAGRMAKDKAWVKTVNLGRRPVTWATLPGIKTVEVSVGR